MAGENFDLVYTMSAKDEVSRDVMSAAEVLQRLGISSEEAASTVEKAMGKIGIQFGAFSSASDKAIASVTNQYGALGKGIDQTSQQIIKSLQETGRIDLGVDKIREQEAAVRQNIATLRLQLVTQEQEAASQEKVNAATTQAIERLRSKIAAEEADANALRLKAADAERYQAGLQRNIGTVGLSIAATERATAANGAARAGFQNLGFQIQDVAVQFASGQRASTIFAQQLPQVSMAITQIASATGATTGVLGTFAKFMSGPWGIAVGIGAAVLPPLIGKLFETKDALDSVGNSAVSAMAKLRASLAQSSVTSDAMTETTTKYVNATAALAKAQRELKAALASQAGNAGQGSVPGVMGSISDATVTAARARVEAAKKEVKDAFDGFAEINSLGNVAAIQAENRARLTAASASGSSTSSRQRAAGRSAGKAYREGAEDELRKLQKITNDILDSFKPGGDRAAEDFARRDANAAQFIRDDLQAKLEARTQPIVDASNAKAGPLNDYISRLRDAVGGTDQLKLSLQAVEVDGLQSLEDGFVGVITGTESVASAFKKMANQIIADLARIAIQKVLFSVLGLPTGSSLFSAGGEVQKKAGGGLITGPGSGTSDDIPAWLSNGEFVMRAEAVRRIGARNLEMLNSGRLPGFAAGGLIGGAINAPRVPAFRTFSGGRGQTIHQHIWQVNARGAVLAEGLVAEMQQVGVRAALGGAQLAESQSADRQMAYLS